MFYSLSIKRFNEYYDSMEAAAEVSRRFLQAAKLLPEGTFLSWQVQPGGIFAFSDTAGTEDLGWIFQDCGALGDPAAPDLWKEGRKIYTLQATAETAETKGRMGALFETLEESGGILRVIAGPQGGQVLIGLPGEMPLRLRAILALAFPDTLAAESRTETLPQKHLSAVMTALLGALMLLPEGENTIPLEALHLSVRAFNCLKRAGFRTVDQLCKLTDNDFAKIRNLGKKCTEEVKGLLVEGGYMPAPPPEEPAADYEGQLAALIGLENVKTQVRKITALAKMKQDMAARGMDPLSVVLNMEFVGNPGTAKTTVARILAGIFRRLGLLESHQPVEVGRADLVGKYVGHTAEQVRSVFARAKGRLLFIDEAYALAEHNRGQFGDEAINTIVQEMENHRADTIVIFAGYPKEMAAFFARNPGLRSRVPFQIPFADYSPEEMARIAQLEAQKRGFSLGPAAREKAAAICAAAAAQPQAGNGRFCRNLVEEAILSYAARVYGREEGGQKDFVLAAEDFTAPSLLQTPKKPAVLGFCK